jgi:hypothetical protein
MVMNSVLLIRWLSRRFKPAIGIIYEQSKKLVEFDSLQQQSPYSTNFGECQEPDQIMP